jgi:HlyD family secretion protein
MRSRFLIFILLGLCTACNSAPNSSSTPPGTAPGNDQIAQAAIASVVALGRIEPEGEVIRLSVPNAQDSRVNKILVKEGDKVRANQVVAILQGLDRREAELRDAKAEVRLRQAELLKVKNGEAKQAQLAAQRATIARLEAQLETGLMQKKAAIVSAEAMLENAEKTYQRRQKLAREGVFSQAEADTAQRDFNTAQATLAEKRADYEQTRRTLQAEILQAREQLQELQEVRPVDIEIALAQLEKAKVVVEQRQANLRDMEVRVPIDGQILRINTRVGEQVSTSQGIVELAKTDRMYAIAEIPEAEIGRIQTGQAAIVSSEYNSFKGEVHGIVEHIGLQVGKKNLQDANASYSPTTDQNTRVIAVKIKINPEDNQKIASFTNMQVRVKIDLK